MNKTNTILAVAVSATIIIGSIWQATNYIGGLSQKLVSLQNEVNANHDDSQNLKFKFDSAISNMTSKVEKKMAYSDAVSDSVKARIDELYRVTAANRGYINHNAGRITSLLLSLGGYVQGSDFARAMSVLHADHQDVNKAIERANSRQAKSAQILNSKIMRYCRWR